MCDKQSLAKGLLACVVVLLASVQYASCEARGDASPNQIVEVVSESGVADHEINELAMKKIARINMLRSALKREMNSLSLLVNAAGVTNEEASAIEETGNEHDDFSRSLDRNKKNALKRGMVKTMALGFGK
jgi:hypothetical protein